VLQRQQAGILASHPNTLNHDCKITAVSSSIKAVSFSSARTTKRFSEGFIATVVNLPGELLDKLAGFFAKSAKKI
jgi:hypothetical protein